KLAFGFLYFNLIHDCEVKKITVLNIFELLFIYLVHNENYALSMPWQRKARKSTPYFLNVKIFFS
ncbi:hypothetical protein, partial [uncultured Muribaculum sp.]|uniref:hypothetical protein n=1 Tax=uncultured Muribaculum sp. TaxID=1918613 RepID=UPI00263BE3BE